MEREEILYWLQCNDTELLDNLWQEADRVRRQWVGNQVYLRGIIEISNFCQRHCHYCGINAANKQIKRYRMSFSEILEVAQQIQTLGYGTVVLQAGEDPELSEEFVSNLIVGIKSETNLTITLSLGERNAQELEAWYRAGADRYLLKFETANPQLFEKIHPPHKNNQWQNRLEILKFLKEIGYEIGSGILIGLPEQTYDDLVNAILLFKELELDMVGNGPFIPHPNTLLWRVYHQMKKSKLQVPNDALMTCKVNALTRIVCPQVNIPSTTALATIDRQHGRESGLMRGANVIMPDFTPLHYRQWYDIYPGRLHSYEPAEKQHARLLQMLHKMERTVGAGAGVSLHFLQRTQRY